MYTFQGLIMDESSLLSKILDHFAKRITKNCHQYDVISLELEYDVAKNWRSSVFENVSRINYGLFLNKLKMKFCNRLKLSIPPNVLKCQWIWCFEFPHSLVDSDSWIIYRLEMKLFIAATAIPHSAFAGKCASACSAEVLQANIKNKGTRWVGLTYDP